MPVLPHERHAIDGHAFRRERSWNPGWSCVATHATQTSSARRDFVAYLSSGGQPAAAIAAASHAFERAAEYAALLFDGPILVVFDYSGDGPARLVVEHLSPRLVRRMHVTPLAPVRCAGLAADARRNEHRERFAAMHLGCWVRENAAQLATRAARGGDSPGPPATEHAGLAYPLAVLGSALRIGAPYLWQRDVRWMREMLVARGHDDRTLRATWSPLRRVMLARVPVGLRGQVQQLFANCLDDRPGGAECGAIGSDEAAEFFASFSTRAGPRSAVARLNARGLDCGRLFVECFAPAQRESGRLWQYGRMSVAEEHRRTAIVNALIDEIGAAASTTASPQGTLLAACAPLELHDVGLKMFASLARLAGWQVTFLGADLTEDRLFDAIAAKPHDVVAFAASLAPSVCALVPLIARLRGDPRTARIPIVVGGAPFSELPDLAGIVGADAMAPDAVAGVELLARLRAQTSSSENVPSL